MNYFEVFTKALHRGRTGDEVFNVLQHINDLGIQVCCHEAMIANVGLRLGFQKLYPVIRHYAQFFMVGRLWSVSSVGH